jgi:streptogramin lyase
MNGKSSIAGVLAAAFLLTACGGGSAGSSLPSAGPPASGGTAPSKKHKVKATIRITIPKKHKRHRVRIHGHYVSAATQSIAIAITPAGGSAVNYNANLTTASNPNCSASLISPLICTVVISLAPASYTATFTTYDGPLSGGGGVNDAPTGNVLSANQSAGFDVLAGQANGINVALDGVAAGVAIVPAANSSFFGNAGTGYSISKCGTASPNSESVSVFGIDADNNLIIGPGAPASNLSSNDPALMSVALPPPSAPNLYTISHPISNTAQTPATLTATVTTAPDAGGSTQTTHVMVQTLGGSQFCGFVTEFPLSNSGAGPIGITTGKDGNLWFTESEIGNIGKITTDGTISEYRAPIGSFPVNITATADNNLWFSDYSNGIGQSTTAGIVTDAATGLDFNARTQGIAPDPTAGVWVTESTNTPTIDKWDGTTLTQYSINDITGQSYYLANAIVYGPDNNFWFTLGSGQIGKITPAGVPNVYQGLAGAPQYIAVGGDNQLWFTETPTTLGALPHIGRMTTTGILSNEFELPSGSNPDQIMHGPDGSMWFTEPGSSQIGRITSTGVITQFPVRGGSSPQGITTGPDCNIWFTECNAAIIGRMQ